MDSGRLGLELSRCESQIERMLAIALDEALPPEARVLPQFAIGKRRCDLLVLAPGRALCVEADGAYWHRGWFRSRADRERDRELEDVGFKTLRFSERAIRADAPGCARDVLARLALPSRENFWLL